MTPDKQLELVGGILPIFPSLNGHPQSVMMRKPKHKGLFEPSIHFWNNWVTYLHCNTSASLTVVLSIILCPHLHTISIAVLTPPSLHYVTRLFCVLQDFECVQWVMQSVAYCRQLMQRGFQKRGELGLVIVHNEVFTQTHCSSNN